MTASPKSLEDVHYPVSLEALGAISWMQFEKLLVALIDAVYGEIVEIRQTHESGDGGRDGEGVFNVLREGPEPLGFNLVVWIEVKQRNHNSIGAAEFGNTTFRASIERVHKLLLATNRKFSKPYVEALKLFGEHHRIDIGLLDGEKSLNC